MAVWPIIRDHGGSLPQSMADRLFGRVSYNPYDSRFREADKFRSCACPFDARVHRHVDSDDSDDDDLEERKRLAEEKKKRKEKKREEGGKEEKKKKKADDLVWPWKKNPEKSDRAHSNE